MFQEIFAALSQPI